MIVYIITQLFEEKFMVTGTGFLDRTKAEDFVADNSNEENVYDIEEVNILDAERS